MKAISTTKKRIVRDITWYSNSNYLNTGLGLIRGYLAARLLGPQAYGLYSYVLLVVGYGLNANFGALAGLSREVPRLKGIQDFNNVQRTKDIALTLSMTVSGIISVGLLVYSFSGKTFTVSPFAWRITALLILLQTCLIYFNRTFRAENRFSLASKLMIVSSILSLGLVPLIIVWGFNGALYAESLLAIIVLFITIVVSRPKLKIVVSKKATLALLKVGLPIWSVGIIVFLLSTIDRWLIIGFLGTTALGLYGITIMICAIMALVSDVMPDVMYPKYVEKYAQEEDTFKLQGFYRLPMVLMASLTAIGIGALYFALLPLVAILLPQYMPGIDAVRIALFRTFFMAIIGMPAVFMITTNRQQKYLVLTIGAVLLNVSLNLLFMGPLKMGISGAALASTLTYVIYSTVLVFYSARFHFSRVRERIVFFLEIYLPLCFVLLVIFLLEKSSFLRYLQVFPNVMSVDINLAIVKLLIYSLMCIPFFILINKRYEILKTIRFSFAGDKTETY